ncbi:MAG: biotin synthase BioB [bacterium]
MLHKTLTELTGKVLADERLSFKETELLLEVPFHDLLYGANRIRERYRGNKVTFCSIINAKSGRCSEDCRFCAQSGHYQTSAADFPLADEEAMVAGARSAIENRAACYSLVTSGKSVCNETDWETLSRIIETISREGRIDCCASLGELNPEKADRLRRAGLTRYHHNIETSENFFPQICSTHSFADKIKTIKTARKAGFAVCSGGIFGLGESWEDRLSMAFTLRDLGVDSVPLNFLIPIKGTPMENNRRLSVEEILKVVALFRFVLPEKDIKVSGGREKNLGDYQSWIFYAGANGFLIGNYLTTAGRAPEKDLRLAADMGFVPQTRNSGEDER